MNVNLLWSSQLFHTRCSWVPQNRMLFVAFSFQCCANALEIAFTARGLVAQPTCFQFTRSLYVPTTFWDCTKQCTRGSAPTSVSASAPTSVPTCVPEAVHQRGSAPTTFWDRLPPCRALDTGTPHTLHFTIGRHKRCYCASHCIRLHCAAGDLVQQRIKCRRALQLQL